MNLIAALAAILILPATVDSIVRLILRLRAGRWSPSENGVAPRDFLVIVPSRAEHARVTPTLASLALASPGFTVRTLLLLDGEDAEAESAGRSTDADVVVKHAGGPTKGAALAWLAREHADIIRRSDCVVLLDVGSEVSPDFFRLFRWSPEITGAQAWLRGSGAGVGQAVASSEASAQRFEDTGREVLGWSVRLRGTGTAFRPEAFLALAPKLVTQVEDTEASLLLGVSGWRSGMLPVGVFVVDEKPDRLVVSARQRARWLAGRFELLMKRFGDLVRLIIRTPFEGVAFCCELSGRPLSLSVPLRIGGCVTIAILEGSRSPLWIVAVVAAATVFVDLILVLRGGVTIRSAAALVASWFVAIVLAPVALFRWMRARRS